MHQIFHRITIKVHNTDEWYSVMKECHRWFGKNWRSQNRVKKKLDKCEWLGLGTPVAVWFDVPNLEFATWITVKMGLPVSWDAGK